MSGTSNVGQAAVYEANDKYPTEEEKKQQDTTPYEEGKENSHNKQDPKDERSIANRLAAAEPQNDSSSGKDLTAEQIAGQSDPTAPARMHGNEPSKGAKIDKQIEDEEAALIAKKDAAKEQSKKARKGSSGH